MKSVFVAALALFLAPHALAQEVAVGHVCALYDVDGVATPGPPLSEAELETARRGQSYTRVTTVGRRSTFQVDYSQGTPDDARLAFQRAIEIWSDHLVSAVPIRVQANFAVLGATTLGQAGPFITRADADSPWYPFALADAIAGQNVNTGEGSEYDIQSTFNSNQPAFDYGLDGRPPANRFDFVTLVLHELGHGLGFVGSARAGGGFGFIGRELNGVTSPYIFDTLVEDAQGIGITVEPAYPNNSRELAALLQSSAVFVDGPETVRVYGERPPLYAPTTYNGGSSYSHWDEVRFGSGSRALMTPRVARGEAYQDPGDITCAFFGDMGWPLGDACLQLTVDGEEGPEVAGIRLERTGPNPVRSATTFRLSLDAPARARVTLADALGRQVAVVFDGTAQNGTALRVSVQSLPSGVYHLLADVDGQRVVRSITVAR